MPILVNGCLLPKALVQEEAQRLAALPAWQALPEGLDKRMQLRQAAEASAIDRLLLSLEAEKDRRAIDPESVAAEIQRLRGAGGCPPRTDEVLLRPRIEADLRVRRTLRDLMGPQPEPSEQDIRDFFSENSGNFQRPESVHAAHIVTHVDETHDEIQAHARIQSAQAELESGEPFAAVADRHSDCRGNGGDLGVFHRGVMVDEFEDVVFSMQTGERSGVFRTPFGFHIAEVRSRIPAGPADLDEVREVIGDFLRAIAAQHAMRQVAGQLRARAQVRRISAAEAEELAAR